MSDTDKIQLIQETISNIEEEINEDIEEILSVEVSFGVGSSEQSVASNELNIIKQVPPKGRQPHSIQEMFDPSLDTIEEFGLNLNNLERDDFINSVKSVCKTEDRVLRLRSLLVDKVSKIDKHALKLPLPLRPSTKRVSSLSRYIDDCYAIQRFLDGRALFVNFDAVPRSTTILGMIDTYQPGKVSDLSPSKHEISINGVGNASILSGNIYTDDEQEIKTELFELYNPDDQFCMGLSNLEKEDFTSRVESTCRDAKSVMNLRSQLISIASRLDKNVMKMTLPMRSTSTQTASTQRYIDDCYAIQSFIDGRIPYINLYSISQNANAADSFSLHMTKNSNIYLPARSEKKPKSPKKVLKERPENYKKRQNVISEGSHDDDEDIEISDLNILLTSITQDGLEAVDEDMSESIDEDLTAITGEIEITETKIEKKENEITFQIMEGATSRGRPTLTTSDGFSYVIKRVVPTKTTWLCRVRLPHLCGALIYQTGDTFTLGPKGHYHTPDPRILRAYGKDVEEEVEEAFIAHNFKVHSDARKKASFACPVCEYKFVFRKLLEEHCLAEHGWRYWCAQCNRDYTNHSSFRRHQMMVHSDVKPFTCDVCGKMLHSRPMLLSHKRAHLPKVKNRKCHECGKAFHSTSILKKHQEIHQDPQYLCTICGKMFRSSQHLREHMNFHTKDTLYKCPYCERTYPHYSPLRLHIRRRHTGERPFKCNYCDKSFVCTGDRRSHERVHTGQGHSKKQINISRPKNLKLLTEATKLVEQEDALENMLNDGLIRDHGMQMTVGHYEEIPSNELEIVE